MWFGRWRRRRRPAPNWRRWSPLRPPRSPGRRPASPPWRPPSLRRPRSSPRRPPVSPSWRLGWPPPRAPPPNPRRRTATPSRPGAGASARAAGRASSPAPLAPTWPGWASPMRSWSTPPSAARRAAPIWPMRRWLAWRRGRSKTCRPCGWWRPSTEASAAAAPAGR